MHHLKLRVILKVLAALGGLILASCASTGDRGSPRGKSASPHQKIGAPYRINGRLYKPAADPDYNKVGIASWYGDQFHGRLTANGEIFDKNRLSAAHTTLPMPSMVEVKNLENGRRIVVRLNDRGPFVDDRIIDLSRAAAKELGFQGKGLAKVRVRYLDSAPLNQLARKKGQSTKPLAQNEQPRKTIPNHVVADPRQISRPSHAQITNDRTEPFPSAVAAQPLTATVEIDPIAALIQANPDTPSLAAARASKFDKLRIGQALLPTAAVTTPPQAAAADEPVTQYSSSNTPVTDRDYWISAGIFPRLADAASAGDALSEIAPTEIVQTAVGGTHQLRLGPFKDRLDALPELARVIERGYSDARIIDPIVY